mmetsp:Transcript_74869/g.217311  ORF Transcript_74869/g.217311 Transcript_74869/m.217311 type:complete len:140 (-) Transcript_74869:654-1073(-)
MILRHRPPWKYSFHRLGTQSSECPQQTHHLLRLLNQGQGKGNLRLMRAKHCDLIKLKRLARRWIECRAETEGHRCLREARMTHLLVGQMKRNMLRKRMKKARKCLLLTKMALGLHGFVVYVGTNSSVKSMKTIFRTTST